MFSRTAFSSVINSNGLLTFEGAIEFAQKNDPWLTGNIHKQNAINAMSVAVNTLPDPKISIGLANLPTDGFDLQQEGMTQAKIGISQVFPRGDTLSIKGEQLKFESESFVYQRKDRSAKVAVTVGSLWLDAYKAQQSIALINKNRALFEKLVDVAQASYSSAVGKTRQQDIVRAQLELTRLEDRLDVLAQQKSHFDGMLSQWLSQFTLEHNSLPSHSIRETLQPQQLSLSKNLPEIALLNRKVVLNNTWLPTSELAKYIAGHPSLVAIDKKIKASKTGIKMAEQKYKPEWGVNASYGYRDDDPLGSSRADLFSVGVSFDLPLFTENKQDNEVKSAISSTEAVKTEKLILMRNLLASYVSAKGRLLRLNNRQDLYKNKLLVQIHDEAEASLTAYTNDDGDFSEVVRSRISVLNAEIDELTLNVEERKLILELNYMFVGSEKNTTYQEPLKNAVKHHQAIVMVGEQE
ncbi:MAG: TolC family protein [Colwellia sp.]